MELFLTKISINFVSEKQPQHIQVVWAKKLVFAVQWWGSKVQKTQNSRVQSPASWSGFYSVLTWPRTSQCSWYCHGTVQQFCRQNLPNLMLRVLAARTGKFHTRKELTEWKMPFFFFFNHIHSAAISPATIIITQADVICLGTNNCHLNISSSHQKLLLTLIIIKNSNNKVLAFSSYLTFERPPPLFTKWCC